MKIETKLNIATALAVIVFGFALCASAVTADWDAVKRLVGDAASGGSNNVSAAKSAAIAEANAHADAAIIAATGAVRKVDGSARILPKYLWCRDFFDSYEDDAAWYYELADMGGACSAVRDGDTFARNFDFPYDHRAEFVVRMAAGPGRFSSVGVSQVGTNLTEDIVTSGAHSRFFKALPGATVDGINENGVVANINVVAASGDESTLWAGHEINAIGAIRWVLDHATSAGMAASNLAAKVYIPASMLAKGYSAHFMIADETETWIVEDGAARNYTAKAKVLTNFRVFDMETVDDPYGTGYERYDILASGGNITSAWFRAAYRRPFSRPTEFAAPGIGTHGETAALLSWANANIPQGAPESLKRNGRSWQTVHTSVYDIPNRVLRVAVQEVADWYVFGIPGSTKAEADPVFEAARPFLCTIEAARQMTNGIPVITAETVGGWGFLTGNMVGKSITTGTNTVITLGAGTRINCTDDAEIRLGGGLLSISANMSVSVLGSRTLANFGIGNAYTKAEVDSLIAGATPSDYNTVKANASAGSSHAARTDNPHGVTAAQIGAFPAASGQNLQDAVQVISLHLNAEDARDIVTNYNSVANMPSRRLEYKEPDGPNAGNWRVVWDELTRWNWLTGEYLPSNFYTKAEVDARTDHIQWGLFDSQTGNFSPEKTVQMSADRVILCKGASYQRTATASGTYFVWTSNEPYTITGVESNGYFRIEDAEGNVTFEIVNGDKVTAAATAGGVSTENVMGITHLYIRYPIEADAHPTLEICNNLTTHQWKPETDSACLANVTWTGVSGNYTAEVWSKSAQDELFVKATYERGSDPYVRYAQAISLQTVKIGNTIYYVGTATISGHTVLTLSLTPQ